MSYLVILQDACLLFVNSCRFTKDATDAMQKAGVQCHPYEEVMGKILWRVTDFFLIRFFPG